MPTKLHIDLSHGVLEVEGETEFVREIYTDFRERLASGRHVDRPDTQRPSASSSGSEARLKSKRKGGVRKQADASNASGVAADSPKIDKNLDTSRLGMFYGQYASKNNAEKILIFLKFITEILNIDNPNTDQVYTCFKATGEKIPKAFAQAFYDTSTKHGYIDFRSAIDLPITIAGDNHFNHSLKKKADE